MSDDNLSEIQQIIELMQSGLVELFDQLRELRKRLDAADIELPPEIKPAALFSEIPRTSSISTKESKVVPKTSPPVDESPSEDSVSSVPRTESEIKHETIDSSEPTKSPSTKGESASVAAARVARLLDPISHELNTGEAPAEIIAEYLLAAKEYLITEENPNEKVARDMDVVLKFLNARGKRGIRDEERDNILRRIKRWKAHLSADRSSS